jgi:hypothetical protein
METVILEIDTDFESSNVLNIKTKKQDVIKSLDKYIDSLTKAIATLSLLKDNICDDETHHVSLVLNDDNKLCIKAESDLAERFVCFGIANYDEYDCESDEDDEDDEDDDENDDDEDDEEDDEDEDESMHTVDEPDEIIVDLDDDN